MEMKLYVKNALPHICHFFKILLSCINITISRTENGKGGKRKVGSTESLDQPQKTFKKDMQTANGKEKLEQIANAAIASK